MWVRKGPAENHHKGFGRRWGAKGDNFLMMHNGLLTAESSKRYNRKLEVVEDQSRQLEDVED